MNTRALTSVGSALLLVLSACTPADPDQITAIIAVPGSYTNTEVVLVGQVGELEADPPGTNRGYYEFEDDPLRRDSRIVVLTTDLPAPGRTYIVRGWVEPSPSTGDVIIRETSRREPVTQAETVMYSAGGVALLLAIALVVTLLTFRGTSKAPTTGAAGMDDYWSQGAGQPVGWGGGQDPNLTQELDGFASSDGDETQVFENWGATLRVDQGPDRGNELPIGISPCRIGRPGGRENHVTLNDKTVSRSHARIERDTHTGAFRVIHESKRNKTLVNGQPVSSIELHDGDRIQLGATILEFHSTSNGS